VRVPELKVKPTVLKLGGSVITHKEKPLTPNMPAIERLASEISQANISHLILVHGGGSFGHPIAKRYAIEKGYKDQSQIMGFSKTRQAMMMLNKLVVDSLIQHNIPAVTVQPSSCIITKQGRIQLIEAKPLRKLLELGFVPVLHGDAVLDSDKGFAILSGDQLVSSLAIRLNAERIIIGIDVDGLYSSDPKTDSDAQLIQHVTPQELRKLQYKIRENKVADVTGGMFGKIMELIPAVEKGIEAMIINAAKPDNVYKALKSERVSGTVIKRGETIAKSN
jgi:isopentenyl phosphate kinase